MTTKTRITSYSDKTVALYDTETFGQIGRLAVIMLEKWGPVVGVPDGEDSQGRAKTREATPKEVVARAFDIAEEAWRVARERDLIIPLPDLNEINADADAKREEKGKD